MDTPPSLTFRIGIGGAFLAPLMFLVGTIAYFVYFRAFDLNALTMVGFVGILLAGLPRQAPAHGCRSISDHHIGPLRQG